ncbi:MAG: sigma-70 family RNA polymerase sigma factor [Nannocystaceae bacterium]|nr:sigma-70 family RNA polymerase sigma factor [Nannocystaceae bacterium]
MTALTPEQTRRVEQFAPRVGPMARKMAQGVSHASADELESAGYEGLIQAAQRYDPETGVPFAAFAYHRVRGAMIDAARRAAPATRRRTRALRALQATQALLEEAEKQQPSPNVGDHRSLRERVEAAAAVVAQATAAVMLARLAPVDPETVGDEEPQDEETRVDRVRVRERVRAALDTGCSPAERAMIEALYDRGLSMHEYAAEVGISTSTISRQHARLVARLAAILRGDPVVAASMPAPTIDDAAAPPGPPPATRPRGPP